MGGGETCHLKWVEHLIGWAAPGAPISTNALRQLCSAGHRSCSLLECAAQRPRCARCPHPSCPSLPPPRLQLLLARVEVLEEAGGGAAGGAQGGAAAGGAAAAGQGAAAGEEEEGEGSGGCAPEGSAAAAAA